MPLIQEEKFKRKDFEKTAEVMSIKLNREEMKLLRKAQIILKQTKRGTAVKQLILIASKVLFDDKMGEIIKIVLDNERKNLRLNISDIEEILDAKVMINQ